LVAVRDLMRRDGITALLVPTTDPHQSEYVPQCWTRRAWLSGFTGSAGELLVTADDAALWTDGRYWIQAARELRGSGIRLMKSGISGVPTLHQRLAAILEPGQVVAVDARTISVRAAAELERAIRPSGARVSFLRENLVDEIWTDRPEPPLEPVQILPPKFSGETTASKLRRVRKEMASRRADALLVSALDAVAWLFNIRGRDTAYNPITIAYGLVTSGQASLFIDARKLPDGVRQRLGSQITIRPYEDLEAALRELAAERRRVWAEEAGTSRWAADLLKDCPLVTEPSPIHLMKARKNATEIAGMKAAHVRDGVAMVRFLRWLSEAVGREELTESDVARQLEALRAEGEHFQGLSFDTISAYGEHAALPHYRTIPETDVPLKLEGMYLVDSGAQYLDGTTDITRTVLLGRRAPARYREEFTRVLKGHIAMATARFPTGVKGYRLDVLARVPLWEAGLDYNHGTGHGIGHFLCVHEGPQSISSREGGEALEPGNILSNEPGHYVEGSHGIRTENLILVVEADGPAADGRRFLTFETITLCPIDTRLMEPKLLTEPERHWLNDYHRRVLKTLGPLLAGPDLAWLRQACAAI